MKPGGGRGGDLAVVLVPGERGSRFAVIDGSGPLFGDTLPFWSTRSPSFARRSDESVLAGFGGAPVWGAAVEGVVIYQDGQVVYESANGTRFGIANDGSSFFVVESMASDVSRLVVRNLDLGIEVHHDLGDWQQMPGVRYTVDGSEVVIGPPGTMRGEVGRFGFFPTDGSEARELWLADNSPGHRVFRSSNEGYFTTYDQRGGVSTAKRRFQYAEGEVSVGDQWTRDLRMSAVSDDGAWLAAEDVTHIHVLDASSGETVFGRLRTEDDDVVGIRDGWFVLRASEASPEDLERCRDRRGPVDIRTVLDETDGTSHQRRLVDVTDEEARIADLRERGLYRTVHEVYDLRTLADGDHPDHYRVDAPENHCGSGDDPVGTLEVRDGRVVYVPRRSEALVAR